MAVLPCSFAVLVHLGNLRKVAWRRKYAPTDRTPKSSSSGTILTANTPQQDWRMWAAASVTECLDFMQQLISSSAPFPWPQISLTWVQFTCWGKNCQNKSNMTGGRSDMINNVNTCRLNLITCSLQDNYFQCWTLEAQLQRHLVAGCSVLQHVTFKYEWRIWRRGLRDCFYLKDFFFLLSF